MYHDTEQVPRRGSKLGGAGMEAIRDVAQQKGSNGVPLGAKLQCITIQDKCLIKVRCPAQLPKAGVEEICEAVRHDGSTEPFRRTMQ